MRSADLELAWAAGFFDGEGNIRYNGHSRGLSASVSQCELEPLERFLAAVGRGRIYGPYTNGQRTKNPVWRWDITGSKQVVEAMDVLLPYLSSVKSSAYHDALVKMDLQRDQPRHSKRSLPIEMFGRPWVYLTVIERRLCDREWRHRRHVKAAIAR